MKYIAPITTTTEHAEGRTVYNKNMNEETWTEYNKYGDQTQLKTPSGIVWSCEYKYNEMGKQIWAKSSKGAEWWSEYDKNGNKIHYIFKGETSNTNIEQWYKYDERNNEIYHKDATGFEEWTEYDQNNKEISYRNSEGAVWTIEATLWFLSLKEEEQLYVDTLTRNNDVVRKVFPNMPLKSRCFIWHKD